MSRTVIVAEQASKEMEEAAAWWARHRSAEQAKRWSAAVRTAIAGLSKNADRCPLSAENDDFAYELRELHVGLGARPTHRVIFTIVKKRVLVLSVRHVSQRPLQPGDLPS